MQPAIAQTMPSGVVSPVRDRVVRLVVLADWDPDPVEDALLVLVDELDGFDEVFSAGEPLVWAGFAPESAGACGDASESRVLAFDPPVPPDPVPFFW